MQTDITIIGAGATGLAAAIFAGEAAQDRSLSIALIDGATKIGAKILISGGGRCNVTNDRVTPEDFCGGPRPMIRSVLRAFDERRTADWMRSLGVDLKTEPRGKVFPTSDKARTVLDALVRRVQEVGVRFLNETRVHDVKPSEGGFVLQTSGGVITAKRIVIATGGLSVPKTGSDGWGIDLARRLGHTIIPTTPALVPLVLKPGDGVGGRFADFSGLTMDARLTLTTSRGKVLAERTESMLFTHFGISGPAVLDLSRHLLRAQIDEPRQRYRVCLGHPDFRAAEEAEAWLRARLNRNPRRPVLHALRDLFPTRLAEALAEGLTTMGEMTREQRMELAKNLAALPLPVKGDRGYQYAEVTAGGVDLREVDVRTMESRRVPGLHLCGEVLDVDGRIGGFNFQWAWSSGRQAGQGAVKETARSKA